MWPTETPPNLHEIWITQWSTIFLEKLSFSPNQEITRLLWNHEAHFRVHKRPRLDTILVQTDSVHNLPHYFFEIRFNIILSSTSCSYKWSLPFRFTDQTLYSFPISPMHHPSHIDFITLITPSEKYKLSDSLLRIFFQPSVIFYLSLIS
jgi:hypothetical protein